MSGQKVKIIGWPEGLAYLHHNEGRECAPAEQEALRALPEGVAVDFGMRLGVVVVPKTNVEYLPPE